MSTLEAHFGLTHPPFPKTAPAVALLRHAALDAILARLHFALRRDTIASLIAESGCGKSTVLALFAQSLDAAHYHVLTPVPDHGRPLRPHRPSRRALRSPPRALQGHHRRRPDRPPPRSPQAHRPAPR